MILVNKKILKLINLIPISFFWAPSLGSAANLKVLDPLPKLEFEAQRLVPMQASLKSCKDCEIENITPYDKEGKFDPAKVSEVLQKQTLDGSLLVINWNRGSKKSDQALIEHLQKKISDGHIIVAAAGRPEPGETILPLGKTLWGQLSNVILIGELQEKEKLVAGTYFGPEMLTALGPKDLSMGEGAGALSFSLKLLPRIDEKKTGEWVPFLKEKRTKHRRLWPTLRDFFGK